MSGDVGVSRADSLTVPLLLSCVQGWKMLGDRPVAVLNIRKNYLSKVCMPIYICVCVCIYATMYLCIVFECGLILILCCLSTLAGRG